MKTSAELHIPSLDGIRGIAALMVFVSHAALPIPEPIGEGQWNIYLSLRDSQGRARIGRTVLAPTVALRVFLVRLVGRVVCGDAVRGGRPVQFDGDALDLAVVVVKRFDALLPPVPLFFQPPKGVWTALVDQVLGGAGS